MPIFFLQGHHNLLFHEEEREMLPFCKEESIAMTSYRPLASGLLAKGSGEGFKRFAEDLYAKGKYGATMTQDTGIIERTAAYALKKEVSKIQIALARLFTKVTAPIVEATKLIHIEEAAKAVDIQLTLEEVDCYMCP